MAVSTLWRPMSRKLESVSSSGKARARVDRVHAVALGDHLAEQALLRAEVVEEPGRGHPDPLGQRRDPGAAVPLGGEELDCRVNDLLPPQVAAGLTAVLVGPGGLAERGAAAARGTCVLPGDPRRRWPWRHWTQDRSAASKELPSAKGLEAVGGPKHQVRIPNKGRSLTVGSGFAA